MFAFALAGSQWLILLFPIWQHCGENAGQLPPPLEKPPGLAAGGELLVSLFIKTPRGEKTACRHAHAHMHTKTHVILNQLYITSYIKKATSLISINNEEQAFVRKKLIEMLKAITYTFQLDLIYFCS